MTTVEIRRLGPEDEQTVLAAAHLFDAPSRPDATRRFLAQPGHHLLFAFDRDGSPLGFISGIETTHPDKGTEMYLYELGVDEAARGRGVGRALVEALATLARGQGCIGMWVGTEHDNAAALATYEGAGGKRAGSFVTIEWSFD